MLVLLLWTAEIEKSESTRKECIREAYIGEGFPVVFDFKGGVSPLFADDF